MKSKIKSILTISIILSNALTSMYYRKSNGSDLKKANETWIDVRDSQHYNFQNNI